jgi:hypothetical protein
MRGLGTKTIEIREAIKAILEEIQPATVRAVCYRLFVQKLIPEMSRLQTDRVGRQLVTLREESIIPWEWVVDETRAVERVACWPDFAAHFDDFQAEHAIDPWVNQPERVIVVSEKATVRWTLQPILSDLKVPMLVCHGYSSATAAHDLAIRSRGRDSPLIILYIGDHDPSGMHMSEIDLPQRLARYGGNVSIERVAITLEDMASLPDFSANDKTSHPLRPWYLRTHGDRCVELDAMPPPVLRERVRAAVLAHVELDAWTESLAREEDEIERLADRKTQIAALLGARQ